MKGDKEMALDMTALNELNKMIYNFSKENIIEVTNVQPGLEAFCEWENEDRTGDITISYPIVTTCHSDKLYIEYLEELGLDTNRFNIWFATLLHELFHAVTTPQFDEEGQIEYLNNLRKVEEMEDEDARLRTYFRLPIEAAATKGAVDFILRNKDLCEIFQAKCIAKMIEFYNANDVIDEDAFAE